MKFVSFKHKDDRIHGGVLEGNQVRPLTASGADSVLAYIAGGATEPNFSGAPLPLEDVTLVAPWQRPPRIFGIGLNYREHAAESKMKVQSVPTVFMKLASSITGPDTDVLLPPDATNAG